MAKPTSLTLTQKQQNQVVSMFKGSKQKSAIRNARKIAEMMGVSRQQVMLFLEKKGLSSYSLGSY